MVSFHSPSVFNQSTKEMMSSEKLT